MSEPSRASIALVFGAVAPSARDVLGLSVHLGCSKEVSSFEVKLQNWNAKYSPGGAYPITVGMDGSISLGRGANCPLVMTCRVERVKCISNSQDHFIVISGRCWGERLFRKTVTKTYTGQKGEEIVKDLIDYFVGLSHTRDGTELIEDTDTTYTKLEYTDSPVWDILKYVAESSDKAGVIGYDFRVAPDGKFEFFPKGSKNSLHYLTEAIDGDASYEKDIVRVRNKVTIYGLADKSVPTDKVSWTRSLTPADGDWLTGSGFLSLDATGAPDGGACIEVNVPGSLYYASTLLMLDAGSSVNAEVYPTLDFQAKLDDTYSGTGLLVLLDNTSKAAQKKISISPDEEWHNSEVGVGSTYANQWDYVQSGFDWTHVQAVQFYFYFPQNVGNGAFRIHSLYFGGRRFSALQQDAASQAAYGLREYVETDEELITDTECDLRAKALLAYLKDPAEYLNVVSTLFNFTTTPVQAGDMQHVFMPNENLAGYYRVEFIEYKIPENDTGILETTIQLGKEPPQLADYIYGLRTFTVNVEKLSRTKIGKRGVPVASSGSGGSGTSVFASNVEIDKTAPVLNLLTNRVLKACVGFDGANFFLVSYTGDLILRSQSAVIRPFGDGSDDLGNGSFRFNKLYLKDSVHFAGLEILTNTRLLQNITADAAIIASGQLAVGRLPRGTAGYVLEAEGAGFDPMYVNPNGRYAPAGHGHDGADISGTLSINQMPRDTAGLILEAEGAGFYPMYVNPNGRYSPAAHNHSMDDITSGGVTADVVVGDGAGGTKTLHFNNGKYTGVT